MARDIVWHGSAEAVFREAFSAELQDAFLRALEKIAIHEQPDITTTRHGHPFDNSVWKLKARDTAGQWRVIYVRGYEEAIYVVNAYHKKSPSGGSEEAPVDIKNTRERLYWAEGRHQVYLAIKAKREAEEMVNAQRGSKGKKKGGKR